MGTEMGTGQRGEKSTMKRAYGTGSISWSEAEQRWIVRVESGWTRRGTRRRVKRRAATKAEAQRILRDLLRASRSDATATTRPTVKTWADQWLDITARRLRPTTWQANRSQVATWIIPTIGHVRLDMMRPADVRAVERAMETAGRRPATISRCRAVLDKMLRDAIIEGHAIPQAVLLVDSLGPGESDRDAIPVPDALAILEAASPEPDASRWVAALLQGMRPAECRGLTWDAVDLDAGTIDVSWQLKPLPYVVARDRSSGFRVPRGYVTRQVSGQMHLVRPKTASGRRVIPLVPWMRESLLAWRTQCPPTRIGLVWPDGAGRPRTDRYDCDRWRDLQDRAQVARVEGTEGRRYDLYEARHTTATLLREAGVDPETIIAIMGHASVLSTAAYLHTDRRRVTAALEAVADRLHLS